MVAARAGAASVVCTDGDAGVVAWAAEGAARNGVGPAFRAARLLWGNEADEAAAGACAVLVAADVAAVPYAPALAALVGTVGRLAGPGVPFVLAYQRRGAEEAQFFHLMAAAGWSRTEVPRRRLHPDFVAAGCAAQVRLFIFTRS